MIDETGSQTKGTAIGPTINVIRTRPSHSLRSFSPMMEEIWVKVSTTAVSARSSSSFSSCVVALKSLTRLEKS